LLETSKTIIPFCGDVIAIICVLVDCGKSKTLGQIVVDTIGLDPQVPDKIKVLVVVPVEAILKPYEGTQYPVKIVHVSVHGGFTAVLVLSER
jgi:hypothetical protein